jgi:hypothetical protein
MTGDEFVVKWAGQTRKIKVEGWIRL